MQLNEHMGLLLDGKSKSQLIWKDAQFSSCIIIARIITNLKGWKIIVKMKKHNCKWQLVTCNCKLNGYIIQKKKKSASLIVGWGVDGR